MSIPFASGLKSKAMDVSTSLFEWTISMLRNSTSINTGATLSLKKLLHFWTMIGSASAIAITGPAIIGMSRGLRRAFTPINFLPECKTAISEQEPFYV